MANFLFTSLESKDTPDKNQQLLLAEFKFLKVGYQRWKKGRFEKPWQAAMIPVKGPDYADRVVLLARKREGQLKETHLKAARTALESQGFKVLWAKRVTGTIDCRDSNGEETKNLIFRPADDKTKPFGAFQKCMTLLAKAYGFKVLRKLDWVIGDEVQAEEQLGAEALAELGFSAEFMEAMDGVEEPKEFDDAELLEDADYFELQLEDAYNALGLDFDAEIEGLREADESELTDRNYCEWMRDERSPTYLTELEGLLQGYLTSAEPIRDKAGKEIDFGTKKLSKLFLDGPP